MLPEFKNSPKPREMKKPDKLKKRGEGGRKKLPRREQTQKLNAWRRRRLNRRQSKLRRKHRVKDMKLRRTISHGMMKMVHQTMRMKRTAAMNLHQTEPTSNRNQGRREAAELRWNTVPKVQNQHLEPTMNSK